MQYEGGGGPRRYAYLVAAIVFIAALIRIAVGVVHSPGASLYSDMGNYDTVAEHIRRGRMSAFDSFYPIGYPGFLAVIYALTDRNFIVVAVVQALLGAATCWLVAVLTLRLTASRTASLVASAATALYPPLIYYGAMLLTESIAPFWFTLSVWLLLRAIDEPTHARTAAAGVTLAIATLIRPNLLVLYPLIVIVTVHAQTPKRLKGLRTAAQIIGFAAPLLLGVAALNSALMGRLSGLSTNGGVNFFLLQADVAQLNYGTNWLAPIRNTQFSNIVNSPVPLSSERYFYREGIRAFLGRADKIRHVVANMSEGFGLGFQAYWPANQFFAFEDGKTNALLRRVLRWCSRAFFWLFVMPIALDAFVQALKERRWPSSQAPTLLALSILIGLVLTSVLFLADPRMHVPFDPVLIAFATAATMRLSQIKKPASF